VSSCWLLVCCLNGWRSQGKAHGIVFHLSMLVPDRDVAWHTFCIEVVSTDSGGRLVGELSIIWPVKNDGCPFMTSPVFCCCPSTQTERGEPIMYIYVPHLFSRWNWKKTAMSRWTCFCCQGAQNIGLSNRKLKSALKCTVWSQCTPIPHRWTDRHEHHGNSVMNLSVNASHAKM